MRWVKDSLYGDIPITDLADELIDTPEMQRLRRINQTAFANLVYPGANHTRFEHSLGVFHLTMKFCNEKRIEKEHALPLVTYALLHDVGHTAFSHVLEPIIIDELGMDHEKVGAKIIESGEINEILAKHGLDPKTIWETKEKLGKVVTGDLGTDRIDYLCRDSKYTGVAYGAIDTDRIMRKQIFRNGKLVLDISGLSAAESMLLARFMMFASVYGHRTDATASLMIQKAVMDAIANKNLDPRALIRMDDWQLSYELLGLGGDCSRIMNEILKRQLYKRVFEKRLKDFKNWLFLGGISRKQKETIEREIAEDAGVSANDIIFYIPKPWFGGLSTKVLYNNDLYNIGEVSLISRVLREAQWDYMYVYVLAKREVMGIVEPHARRVIEAIENEKI